MKPVSFACSKIIPRSATDICSEVADVARWREFSGYAILPGIESAEYEVQTENMVGSRIRVRNRDGSEHIEEILEWVAGERIVMKLQAFTPPLSRLATHFVEEWRFEAEDGGTHVSRAFQLFPANSMARPFLWMISLFFRRAIALHLTEMAE